jgi:hypothetical protein
MKNEKIRLGRHRRGITFSVSVRDNADNETWIRPLRATAGFVAGHAVWGYHPLALASNSD